MKPTTTLVAAVFVAATALACGDEARQDAREDVAAARQEAAREIGEVREDEAESEYEAAKRAAETTRDRQM